MSKGRGWTEGDEEGQTESGGEAMQKLPGLSDFVQGNSDT
jgi:hypothetical protein